VQNYLSCAQPAVMNCEEAGVIGVSSVGVARTSTRPKLLCDSCSSRRA
jgi:hypothetical protein